MESSFNDLVLILLSFAVLLVVCLRACHYSQLDSTQIHRIPCVNAFRKNTLAAELYVQLPAIPLLDKPFMRTYFSRCAFRSSAPTVWNLLPQTVLISDSLTVSKSRLKTVLFNQAFIEH